jgi:hypothetical protein
MGYAEEEPLMQRTAVKEEGYKRMTSPAFKPHGIRYSMHDMLGMAKEDWEQMLLATAQDYYIKLVKRKELTAAQRKHLNGLKRWFNVQKWTHSPWRTRIENFFRTRVKRVRENKEKMSLEGPAGKSVEKAKKPDEKVEKKLEREATLRCQIVRLAFAKASLRGDLLPLLRDC